MQPAIYDAIRAYKPATIHRLDLEIDEFTPCLRHTETGEILNTSISIATHEDFEHVQTWRLREDWKKYLNDPEHFSVYKITLEGDTGIQGLVCFEKDHQEEQLDENEIFRWIELSVVESAPHNVGQQKRYAGVAAHLLAIVCKNSFDSNCSGFVSFFAKNEKLFAHYQVALGANPVDDLDFRLLISSERAKELVDVYFNKEG